MTNHMLFHFLKGSILWQLINFFGVAWVLHSTVRGTLLNWYGSFVEETLKEA